MRPALRRILLGGGAPDIIRTNLLAEYRLNEGTGYFATANRALVTTPPKNLFVAPDRINAAGGSNFTLNAGTDPLGGSTAARWNHSGTATFFRGTRQTSGVVYTASIYVKSNTGLAQKIRMYGAQAYSADKDVPASGWTRLSHTYTANQNGNANVALLANDAAAEANDLLVWGPQIEVGSSATAYEQYRADLGFTGGATWDTAGIDLNAGTNYALGTLPPVTLSNLSTYVLMKWPTASSPGYTGLMGLFGGDFANNDFRVVASNGSQSYPSFVFKTGTAYNVLTTVHDGNWHLLSGTYDGATAKLYIDDTLLASLDTVQASVAVEFLQLGSLIPGAYQFTGNVAYATLYSVAHTRTQQAAQFVAFRAIAAARGLTLSPLPAVIAFEGDSLTTGNGIATPYPDVLIPNLSPRRQARNFAVGSAKVTNNAGNDLTTRAASVDLMLGAGRRNVLHILIGANDMTAMTPADFVANLKAYCLARRAAGWNRIIIATILPNNRTAWGGGTANAWRATANGLIAADPSFYDGISDLAADPTIGPDGAEANTTYYADGTHLTQAAQNIAAGIVQTAITAALA